MLKLILIMGLPLAGKTTLSRKLGKRVISMDEYRKVLTGTYIPGEHNNLVYGIVQKTIEYYLQKGEDVIVEGALLSKKVRSHYINLANMYGAECEIYFLDPLIEEIEYRLNERNKIEPERYMTMEYVKKLIKIIEIPMKTEGVHEIHYIR